MEGKVVFASGKAGDYDIWSLDLATRELGQLTDGAYWNDCPKWSPDGQENNFYFQPHRQRANLDDGRNGLNQAQVTETDRWHGAPAWSPDGKRIVFCANYDGNINIYVLDLAAAIFSGLLMIKVKILIPRFSPDGKKIIFGFAAFPATMISGRITLKQDSCGS